MKINDTTYSLKGFPFSDFKVGEVGRLVECGASDPKNVEATPPGDLYLFGSTSADAHSPSYAINLRTGLVLDGLARLSTFTLVDAEVVVK